MDTTITFMVPWLPILFGLGAIGLILKIRKIRIRVKERDAIAKVNHRKMIQGLFPSPWDAAYEKCWRIWDNPKSRVFLRQWLTEQKNLPLLSPNAVHVLACQLTFEHCEKWEECLNILAPYDANRLIAQVAAKKKESAAKVEELKKKQSLFQYPWDAAYNACRTAETWAGAQLWLQKWIAEQDGLPTLSVEAAEELMRKVAESNSPGYRTSFGLLSRYLETGSYMPSLADYNLRDTLPKEWYEFWKEIKSFPSRRVLFLKKTGKYNEEGVHPVVEVSLTTEQATLLSRALASGEETEAHWYASDLASFVSMKGELECGVIISGDIGTCPKCLEQVREKRDARPAPYESEYDSMGSMKDPVPF